MSNKTLVRGILERIFNARDLTALDDGFTADAAIHDPGTDFHGPTELRHGLERMFTAFPDFRFSALDELGEDDRVVLRYSGQGTHRGEFLGIEPTGRRIEYTGLIMVRVQGEQIAEFWAQPDQLGILKQLGAQMQLALTDSEVAGPR